MALLLTVILPTAAPLPEGANVEVKAVDALLPVHQAQVLTYLRLTGCPAGLLVNFNVPRLTDGVRRLSSGRSWPTSAAPLLRVEPLPL